MAIEKINAGTPGFYAPRFEVKIANSKLPPDISSAILSVKVEEKLNLGATFEFTISEEFDRETQKFLWLDNNLIEVGGEVEIKMGYGSSLQTFVMGEITGVEPTFFSQETPTIKVKGKDLSYDYIKKKSQEKTFVNMAYSDIVQDIAKKAGLNAKVDKTAKYKGSICKKNDQSYFSFIEELAKKAGGFEFRIDEKTLYFVKPGAEKKELLTLELGKDIISFSPSVSTDKIYSEIEVRAHNLQDPSKPIVGKAKAGSERKQESGRQTASQIAKKNSKAAKKVITDIQVNSVKEANDYAKAEMEKASSSLVTGTVSCIGIPQIRTGVCIYLDKMGERFSGKYYVNGTTHNIDSSGYKTSFSVERNAI
jgi:phage protein D